MHIHSKNMALEEDKPAEMEAKENNFKELLAKFCQRYNELRWPPAGAQEHGGDSKRQVVP